MLFTRCSKITCVHLPRSFPCFRSFPGHFAQTDTPASLIGTSGQPEASPCAPAGLSPCLPGVLHRRPPGPRPVLCMCSSFFDHRPSHRPGLCLKHFSYFPSLLPVWITLTLGAGLWEAPRLLAPGQVLLQSAPQRSVHSWLSLYCDYLPYFSLFPSTLSSAGPEAMFAVFHHSIQSLWIVVLRKYLFYLIN